MSDSEYKYPCVSLGSNEESHYCNHCGYDMCHPYEGDPVYVLGPKDLDLLKRLSAAGPDHGKFLRMVHVQVDVTAPLFWWKEYDTYKVGTVANSCSTMHKIHARPFCEEDMSCENLVDEEGNDLFAKQSMLAVIADLNRARELFLETKDKRYWRIMIELLPSSYNQLRTLDLNYAVLKAMYWARRDHKLTEWHTFCEWIESLPYARELICGGK